MHMERDRFGNISYSGRYYEVMAAIEKYFNIRYDIGFNGKILRSLIASIQFFSLK